jgi:hypothetical protein
MDRNFKRWVAIFVLVPFALFLLLFNIILWTLLNRNHQASLQSICEATKNNLEAVLATQTVRLQNMGLLPSIDALLVSNERISRNAMPQRRDQVETLKEQWRFLSRDDFEVREVLENSVAEMFQRVCKNDAETIQFVLTDADGLVVAATFKPERYSFGDEDWWIRAHTRDQSQPVSDGLVSNDVLGLALALRNPQRTNFVSGVLRVDLALSEVASWLKSIPADRGRQVFVASTSYLYSVSSDKVDADFESIIYRIAGNPPTPWGWKNGYRYSSKPLNAGIRWTSPVYVIALRPEFIVPLPMLGTMGLTIFLSLVAFWGIKRLSFDTGHRMFFKENVEYTEAGKWAMSQYKEKNNPASAFISATETGDASISAELNQWLENLKQAYKVKETLRMDELPFDLELAKDFQLAYMERAYPKIPAEPKDGHLYLSFCHRYQSAMALGGDFFDIFAAAPDCAGVFVADVMGHGTRSALVASVLRALILDHSSESRNARFFLSELNKAFSRMLRNLPEPLFVSAFYLVADVTSRVATFSSAGHPPPFLIRRSSRRIARLETPEPRGMVMGVFDREEYTAGQCRLMDGDCFLLFTDGLYEARNSQGQEFGLQRVYQVLEDQIYNSKEAIVDRLMKAVADFVGAEKLPDDICVVAVDVSTKAKPA